MHVLRFVFLIAALLLAAAAVGFLLWSRIVWNYCLELGRKPNQPRIGITIEAAGSIQDTSSDPDSIAAELSRIALLNQGQREE